MNNSQLSDKIKQIIPDVEITETSQYLNVTVSANQLHQLAKELKENSEMAFDYLFNVTGVDMPDHFRIVYHLESTKHRHAIVLKTRTNDRENPAIDTVCDIWETANFHEREVYDLMGVKFNNHPDLRRLFLDDSWGFPLRKDYTDNNIVLR